MKFPLVIRNESFNVCVTKEEVVVEALADNRSELEFHIGDHVIQVGPGERVQISLLV
ncbi:hypothetical protein D3C81_1813400 [compost metagenome]